MSFFFVVVVFCCCCCFVVVFCIFFFFLYFFFLFCCCFLLLFFCFVLCFFFVLFLFVCFLFVCFFVCFFVFFSYSTWLKDFACLSYAPGHLSLKICKPIVSFYTVHCFAQNQKHIHDHRGLFSAYIRYNESHHKRIISHIYELLLLLLLFSEQYFKTCILSIQVLAVIKKAWSTLRTPCAQSEDQAF